MGIQISKKDIIWSYAGYFFALFANVLILPFVMKLVKSQELGLWYTFLSIGQLAGIFDGMFSRCVSRSFTYAWSGVRDLKEEGYDDTGEQSGKPNYHLLVAVLKTSRFIFMVMAGVVGIFLISLGTLYVSYTARELPWKVWASAWLLYCAAVYLNIFYSYWITALQGVGALQQAQKALIISRAVYITISLMGLSRGSGVVALAAAYLLSGLVLRIYGKTAFLHYEETGESCRKLEKTVKAGEMKHIFQKIWFNARKSGAVCLATFVITQSTTLICSGFLGLDETAAYGLSLQVVTTVAGVAAIYFNAMRPKMTEYKIAGERQKESFMRLMSMGIFLYWLLYWFGILLLIFIGIPLIGLWKPNTSLPIGMVAFMGFYLFLEYNHSLFAAAIEMSNKIPYVKAGIVSSVFILAGELAAVRFTAYGIYGLMFVQFVVQLCYNNWKWPMVIMKEYSLSPWRVLKLGCEECTRNLQRLCRNYIKSK